MRAGRLVSVMLILQRRGRVTAAELAAELEVSERTVLRDIEALSGAGVPVFAVRGRGGGFELLGDGGPSLPDPAQWRPVPRRVGRPARARVLLTPEGRRLATVLGLLQPLRVRPGDGPRPGWLVATFRIDTFDDAVMDVLTLSPHVEVLEPAELRDEVSGRLSAAAALYADGGLARASRPRTS